MAKKRNGIKRPPLHRACKIFPPLSEDQLNDLASDIGANGLLNPIVMLDNKLLDGRNRFAACQIANVKPRFVQFKGQDPVGWVASMNLARRHLSASQKAVVAFDLMPLLEKEAKERQRNSNNYKRKERLAQIALGKTGKAAEQAAKVAGASSRSVESIKSIHSHSPELIERIRSGELNITEAKRLATVDQQRVVEKKARGKLAKRRAWKIIDDQKVIKCDCLIVDPPYGITSEPWEPDDLESYTKEWCSRWSKCGANFIAIFWSQAHLFEGKSWFEDSLDGYKFQQLLVWHATNNAAFKDRKCFKKTWEPIFLFRRRGSNRKIIDTRKTWDTERHNGDCFAGAIPQTVYNGEELKQHPCQKPVSVMRWLIHALTEPGEKVISPFCGVAPCGIASTQLGRRYHGIEINKKYRRLAEERIAAYGKDEVVIQGGKRSKLNGKLRNEK